MSNFFVRALSGLIYAIIFISCIYISEISYVGLLIVLGIACLWEFSKIVNARILKSFLIATLVTLITIFILLKDYPEIVLGFTIFCALILLYYLFTLKRINYSSLQQKVFLKYIYIILPFLFLIKLPFLENVYTPNIILYIILLIWTNDSFAFLVGKNFGKHKLFEKVSPKKTIEGFIGGISFAILGGFLIGKYSGIFSITDWIIIAIIVAIFGNLGDLVESKFKRQANIKDSGTIMPGHGGLLDRLDSLFFLAPFVYLYIHYIM